MTEDPLSETRLDDARGYLAACLADEDFHGDDSLDWFTELSDYVTRLLLSDQLITRAAIYLQPFLDDDDRIECAMYPNGGAVKFIAQTWGGDLRAYLMGFLDAMERDHARWETITADAGKAACWMLATGPSTSTATG